MSRRTPCLLLLVLVLIANQVNAQTRQPGSPKSPGGVQRTSSTCPRIPGYGISARDSRCSCLSGGVIVVKPGGGGLTCSGSYKGPRYAPGVLVKECPFTGDELNEQWCSEYCNNCLDTSYQSDTWAIFWQGFNAMFGILTGKDFEQFLKGGALGDDQLKGLSCLSSFISQMIAVVPAYRSGDPVAIANLWGDLNAGLFGAGSICNAGGCAADLAQLGNKFPVANALFNAACALGVAGGHYTKCKEYLWQCEATLYGNKAIPNCAGIIDDPVWKGRPIQEPQVACFDCCITQVVHVYPECEKSPKSPLCQFHLNNCLMTCKKDEPPAPPSAPSSPCPVLERGAFCKTQCPSKECNELMPARCYINDPLINDPNDPEVCRNYFRAQTPPTPECITAQFCQT
jgi:hypothetical protein